MSKERTPVQIILIEQVLNSIYVFIVFGLFINYAPRLLIKHSGLGAETITFAYIGISLAIIFGWFYIWLPYTCVRIWRSTKLVAKSFWIFIFKGYSGALLLTIVISGFGALMKLPEIISVLKNIN